MAGAGYKLFNTGDVLTAAQVNTYLMEQTVMVFADAAARTTALTGVVSEGMISYLKDTNAVEVYNGSAWVASDDPNAIQNTIVDAKGDLISATAADTPARLAVGNNGETLVADSSTSTGLRYTAGNAVGNPVINSAFQIWQRGTSFTPNASTYTADRWAGYRGTTGMTVSRQTTGDTTNLPNIQYCARVQRDSGNTSTGSLQFGQMFETVNSIPYAGKTVTLSFYARKGANFSAGNLDYYLITGTGTDQNYFSSYTGAAFNGAAATLTTTWARYSATFTLSSTMTEMCIVFSPTMSGTAGAADYYEVTGIQIDLGSTALPYRTYSATLAGELAACQRYYYRSTSGTAFGSFGVTAIGSSTTIIRGVLPTPVSLRTIPTSIDFASLCYLLNFGGGTTAITNATIYSTCATAAAPVIEFTTTGTATNSYYQVIANNSATAYIGLSAEL